MTDLPPPMSRPEEGSSDDLRAAMDLIHTIAQARNNGQALAAVLSYRHALIAARDAQWAARIAELEAEVAELKRENHNLNWALGKDGYDQMATPEEQAEHEAATARIDAVLARMAENKAKHDAMVKDAERYRWLRDSPATVQDDRGVRQWLWSRPGGADAIDAAIDAALSSASAATNAKGSRDD